MTKSRLIQIKASAGSGKTFALTGRFLDLLRRAERDPCPPVCAGVVPRGFAWPEIMAVTFTNKAAAEMKERVVGSLKERALGIGGPSPARGWEPGESARALELILNHFQRLNIRTIDSLLNLLMTLFALELGVTPDFELSFDTEKSFDAVFERFIALCEEPEGESFRTLYLQMLQSLVSLEGSKGFWLTNSLKRRLLPVFRAMLTAEDTFLTDTAVFESMADATRQEVRRAAQTLTDTIDALGAKLDSRFSNMLAKCACLSGFDAPPDSAYARKASVCECVLKAGRDKITDAAEAAYERLKRAMADHGRAVAAAWGGARLAPAVNLCRVLLRLLDTVQAENNSVLYDRLAVTVRDLLGEGHPASEAYCRLGTRLTHLMIDEFQDTNRDQWEAILPLAEECLAKNGSLFYVGDVKQAIYGWRGGDSSLFDEVPATPSLAVLEPRPASDTLPTNWRSLEEIVFFNNDFFELLASGAGARKAAATLLGSKADPRDAARLVRAIETDFAAPDQALPTDADRSGGFVHIEILEPGDGEDIEEAAREPLCSLVMDELLTRRGPGEVAVLVRTNAQARTVSDWLVELNLPVITDNSFLLARHPIVRQLIALLSFIDYPLNDTALAETVMGRELFLSAAGIEEQRVLDWLATRPKGAAYKSFAETFPEAWSRLIEPFYKKSGLLGAYDLSWEIISAYRVLERYPDHELFIRRFLELAHQAEEDGARSLSGFLNLFSELGEEEKVPFPDDVDAVRVMTVHKAKGLEFPVVILPFMEWKASVGKEEISRLEHGGAAYLAPTAKGLGEEYARKLNENLIEQLNLLYVAWTRPREELHVYLPPPSGKSQQTQEVVHALLGEELSASGIFERGEPAERPARPTPTASPGPGLVEYAAPEAPRELMAWLPRLRVYKHSLEDLQVEEKTRGEVVHKALELFNPSGDPAIAARDAAWLAIEAFPAYSHRTEEFVTEFQEIAAWLMAEARLAGIVSGGLREMRLMDKEGRILRPDLVAVGPDGTLVVDYKTGGPSDSHAPQVRGYMRLIAGIKDFPAPVSGLIVYLDQRRCVEVG